jgi:hypothetical protein
VSIYPSWTLLDVPITDSILIYSHFVQTVLTSRLRINWEKSFSATEAGSVTLSFWDKGLGCRRMLLSSPD